MRYVRNALIVVALLLAFVWVCGRISTYAQDHGTEVHCPCVADTGPDYSGTYP